MDQLPRRLGLVDATLIVVGIVIGSGIFLLPNLIARNLPSGPAIVGVWLAAGVLSWFGALAYAELGAMMPATGGQYVYLREAYGDWCAFLCGWVFALAAVPGGIAFLAVGFAIYLDRFIPLSAGARTAVSLTLVAGLSVVNAIGMREGVWVQRIFTSLKIGGLLLVIFAAIFAPAAANTGHADLPPLTYAGFGIAMSACLMAYNGWSYVSFVAGEVKRPERNLRGSLALGMATVVALYVSANLAYLHVLRISEIAATERPAAAMAEVVMGPRGATMLSAVILLSIVGAINGCILTGARIPFAQARDGLFFARFGRIHPRFETPAFAIAMQGLWTCLLIVTGSYQSLSSYTIISAWIIYTMTVAAVRVLRRKAPDAQRPYRMWGYPFTLWIFVAVSVWFLADAVVNQPKVSLIAIALAGGGVPAYFIWRLITLKHRIVKTPPARRD